MLVYELVPNGSLDKHLHDPQRLLAWTDRYRYSNSSSELRITQPFISDFHLEFVLTQVQDCARCGLGHTVPPHGVRAVRLARGHQACQHLARRILQRQARGLRRGEARRPRDRNRLAHRHRTGRGRDARLHGPGVRQQREAERGGRRLQLRRRPPRARLRPAADCRKTKRNGD